MAIVEAQTHGNEPHKQNHKKKLTNWQLDHLGCIWFGLEKWWDWEAITSIDSISSFDSLVRWGWLLAVPAGSEGAESLFAAPLEAEALLADEVQEQNFGQKLSLKLSVKNLELFTKTKQKPCPFLLFPVIAQI